MPLDAGGRAEGGSKYDRKDEAYFGYYSMLTHQAQMLQDSVRTSAYQMSIINHALTHFQGAGNGILSLFALQAGARLVHAVEASNMADCLRHVVQTAARGEDAPNAWIQGRLSVVHAARVEDVTAKMLLENTPDSARTEDAQVDTIVSECLGVLLVHERMCETFIEARDKFLRPGGSVFPRTGSLCFSLLNDARLWQEVKARGDWWNMNSFYGVDLTPFTAEARDEAFSSPVVGCFLPVHVVGAAADGANIDSVVCRYVIDFLTIEMAHLKSFDVPLAFDCVDEPVIVHGLGAWFDLSFLQPEDDIDAPDSLQNAMTTSPFAPATHWAQVRLLLEEPLALNRGQRVLGTLHFNVNEHRSYDVQANLYVPQADGTGLTEPLYRRAALWKLDKQTYSWETL
ncbi:type I protein arginine methyltransferase [Malassezia equina]|uniref:type I protein arginine methyltransferase n=1 Tax=Malassezia equina TaxID=1381935 RepID=A0AAF0EHF7_9BASI|nr:type I protein arginine methyltransferase [Malassezia equina]